MREKYSMAVERTRVLDGRYGSQPFTPWGLFMLPNPRRGGPALAAMVGPGGGWEHVSVSIPDAARCPSWDEMCWVKGAFFSDDECVMQLHPPKDKYVSCHPYTLHLWRPMTPADGVIPQPPTWMVGPLNGQTAVEAAAEGNAALEARGE